MEHTLQSNNREKSCSEQRELDNLFGDGSVLFEPWISWKFGRLCTKRMHEVNGFNRLRERFGCRSNKSLAHG